MTDSNSNFKKKSPRTLKVPEVKLLIIAMTNSSKTGNLTGSW